MAQRSSFVDIDHKLIFDHTSQTVKGAVLNQLDLISKTTKADIFLLTPKQPDIETASYNGNVDTMDPRLRCAIFGDLETMEHAKTRVLIMIDQIVSLSPLRLPLLFSKHHYSQSIISTLKSLLLLSKHLFYSQLSWLLPNRHRYSRR